MVEPASRYEEIKIPLSEPIHGLDAVSAVLGVPRWWPTGSRVGVVIAHGANADMNSEAVEGLHRALTERRYFSLRFNFPFAEAGKRRPDSLPVLRRTMRAALGRSAAIRPRPPRTCSSAASGSAARSRPISRARACASTACS